MMRSGALPLAEVDDAELTRRFAGKVLGSLVERQLIDNETAAAIQSWEHSGFHVYAAKPVCAENVDALLFLARYLKKAPLVLERLSVDESGLAPVVHYAASSDFPPHLQISRFRRLPCIRCADSASTSLFFNTIQLPTFTAVTHRRHPR